jgi:Protein of unknown function (DUF3592)
MNSKEKTTLAGGLLLSCGLVGVFIFAVVYLANLQNAPSSTSTVSGTVVNYTPAYSDALDRREGATCIVNYKVGDKSYNIVATCGFDTFGLGDRLGDKVEVIYSTENPAKGWVKRTGFLYFMGVLTLSLIVFGYLLLRKGRRMEEEPDEESFLI